MRSAIAQKWLPAVLWATLILSLIGLTWHNAHNPDYSDFDVYRHAGQRALAHEWADIFSVAKDGSNPYRYSPAVLPFFLPFAAIPSPEIAKFLFQWLQLLCLGLAIGIFLRARPPSTPATLTTLALSLLIILRGTLNLLKIGQISGFLALSFSIVYWALQTEQKNVRVFGAMLGAWFGFFFKLLSGLPLLLFLAKPRVDFFRNAFFAALALLFFFGGAWIILGCSFDEYLSLYKGWGWMATHNGAYFDGSHIGSQSIKSSAYRMFTRSVTTDAQIETGWKCLALLYLGLTVYLFRFRKTPFLLEKALGWLVLGYLLLMPETFKHALPLLFFPAFIYLACIQKTRARKIIFAAVFLFFGVLGRDLIGRDATHFIYSASLPCLSLIVWSGVFFRSFFVPEQ